jgi:hypothetical protein
LGWNAVNDPDGVANHGVTSVVGSSGVVWAVYGTVAVNLWWSLIVRLGVITSSSPCQADCVGRPSTSTRPTESPAKSRLKRERSWVARDRMTASPWTVCSGAAVG